MVAGAHVDIHRCLIHATLCARVKMGPILRIVNVGTYVMYGHDRLLDAFHASHFLDPARRAWFTEKIAQHDALDMTVPTNNISRQEQEDAWTYLAPGEDEASWQARHGVQYLTPGAVRMFDTSRRFREQRT